LSRSTPFDNSVARNPWWQWGKKRCDDPGWIVVRRVDEEKLRRKDHLQHPAGRVGRPEDIAEMAAFLLDRDRAGFVTGANFVVDGGMTRKMIYEE